jgi:hypothetical protein
MSALFLVVDVVLAGIFLTWIWPLLPPDTTFVVVIIGAVVITWKWTRDY